jgi:pectate lyase
MMAARLRYARVVIVSLALAFCAWARTDPNAGAGSRVICRAVGAGRIVVEPNVTGAAKFIVLSGPETASLSRDATWTTVKLTAEPNAGWTFSRWAGDVNAVENPIYVGLLSDPSSNVEQVLHEVALFTNADPNALRADQPVGFAGAPYQGLSTTTGGAGGDVIVVTTGQQLRNVLSARQDSKFIKGYPPVNIVVLGKLTFSGSEMIDVKETYHVSIVGAGSDATIEGFGLNIYRSHNVIVRNIEFRSCPDDAVNICDVKTHHVWVDHCTLSDGPDVDPGGERHDGLIDVKQGAGFVTVSWNHFANHHKTCLLGHSDNNGEEDMGRLKATYHHNWFDNTASRHPRVRFGECHVFNNYYDGSRGGMGYGIASTMEADVVVEGNYFQQVPDPTYCGYGDSGPGDLVESDNAYVQSGLPATRGTAFDPSVYYTVVLDRAWDVPSLVMTGAGAGKTPVAIIAAAPKGRQ